MHLCNIHLVGFRNFRDTSINLNEKSLVIGPNDVGKTNLMYALRILLDKSISESDLEPHDSDFYAFEETNELSITIKFENVVEDCVLAKFREYISDDGTLYLCYRATRDITSNKKSYIFQAGRDLDSLEELQSRFYLKVLNVKYIGSDRDLYSYVKKERRNLLQDVRNERSETEVEQDSKVLQKIDKTLKVINRRVRQLGYVNRATESINEELQKLSYHHSNQQVKFDVGALDTAQFVENLKLISDVNGRNVSIGGDGRNNQIFLALWAARNEIQEEDPLEVSIYCIEEPEAHLHPHQQRRLAEYLVDTLKGQVIITSHSPQIACEFSPDSIIRLYSDNLATRAANDGCGKEIENAVSSFGFRLNVIPAEAFFSSVVLLVEGISEVLFYKALAKAIDIDLDQLNISILMVDGVGFNTYVELLNTLGIDFVIRTDNDIFKIQNKNEYRCAGIQRGIGLYRKIYEQEVGMEKILKQENLLKGFKKKTPPKNVREYVKLVKQELEDFDIFISQKDLENDLVNSNLFNALKKYYETEGVDDQDIVNVMQKRKGTTMYHFLLENIDELAVLQDSEIARPLIRCKELAEEL